MTIVFFSWEHVFLEFSIWRTSYFQCILNSPWENDYPYNKETKPYDSGFQLGLSDQTYK
jgi:hypothetical protein